MNSKSTSARLLLTLSIIGCIILIGFLLTNNPTPPPPTPVIVMKMPYTIPTPRLGILDRIMPPGRSWIWLWNLRYAILGKNPTINLDISIFDARDLDLSSTDALARPDLTTTEGLQIWRIKQEDSKKLQLLMSYRIFSSLRLITGSRVKSSIHSGNSMIINGSTRQLGVSSDLLPVIRKDSIDLTATFRCLEPITNLAAAISVRTNLEVAGRFQLSQDAPGLLIVPAPVKLTDQKQVALFLTSKVQRQKK